MNDFDFADFLNKFTQGCTKEEVIKKYVNGLYSKEEFIERMKLFDEKENN